MSDPATILNNLGQWLGFRSQQDCKQCGAQNEHDICDNEVSLGDLSIIGAILTGKNPEDIDPTFKNYKKNYKKLLNNALL